MAVHIGLLGDSIFDNAAYVSQRCAVLDHLNDCLADDDRATLIAVDGAVIDDVHDQIDQLPPDVTHVVLSVGGNDALRIGGNSFQQPCGKVIEGLAKLAPSVRAFEERYRQLIEKLVALSKPVIGCTIYDRIPGLSEAERIGLTGLNDVITRTLFAAGVTLLDLRLLCDQPEDYSELSPIEPSSCGGKKIAAAIAAAVSTDHVDARVIWRARPGC